jgi:taurine dioxygenase
MENFKLHHLSPAIGTEIQGIDLSRVLSTEIIDWLTELLVERKVLFFRDQALTADQHIAFAARFGELVIHPFTKNNTQHPEVIQLYNDKKHPPKVNKWHSDVTWRKEPSLGSILLARELPEVGGDTLFANMELAYEKLESGTKNKIKTSLAYHDNQVFLNNMRASSVDEEAIATTAASFPPVKHPVSGRKALYVNQIFTRSIDGLDPDQSDKLLIELSLTAWNPDIQCRFRWRKNSVAFWDNRAAQHYAAADYWPNTRKMDRVTIQGDVPC